MRKLRLFTACMLLGLSAAANAQTGAAHDGLTSLRGFQIGAQCASQQANYDLLRAEQFKAVPPAQYCDFSAGKFRTHWLLQERDGNTELVELSYAPDASLWRVKVSMTWAGTHRLSEKPTPDQVKASLVKRFGTPFAKTNEWSADERASDGSHTYNLTWATRQPGVEWTIQGIAEFARSRMGQDLQGTVTNASLFWFDNAPKQSLVVEMINQEVLPKALAAQDADALAAGDVKARRDASMLNKL